MIRIENLSKRFGGFLAIRDLDLHVRRGEVFGFLGPNGAGKTTTMKIIVGLMRPTSGRVRVAGMDVEDESIRARKIIGYIPDHPFIYEKLSGREFMLFIAGVYGMDLASTRKRADELLRLFELSGWANELIESYSHGMKQRLIMAAALLHRPELVVVDEPMVGLDPRGAVLVKGIFKNLCASGQGTVFLSTHTLEVAEEMCDRVAILHQGRIVALGTMDEIRRRVGGPQHDEDLQELFLRLTGGADVKGALQEFEV